jgi:type VI secretion system protein VasD
MQDALSTGRSRWRARLGTPVRVAAAAILGVSLAGGGLGLLAACSSAPPPKEVKPCDVQMVTLYIYSADNINPNDQGKPRPVVVRLYQLKSEVKLQNAQYDDVLLKDKEVLGDDVVKVDEVEVYPNDLVRVKFERSKEASSLGGVALFHGPKGHSWQTYYQFPLMPGGGSCGAKAGDAGKPQADPQTAFFIESTKIDNGSEMDESMFTTATAVREVNLPKGGGAPGGGAGDKGAAPGPTPSPK